MKYWKNIPIIVKIIIVLVIFHILNKKVVERFEGNNLKQCTDFKSSEDLKKFLQKEIEPKVIKVEKMTSKLEPKIKEVENIENEIYNQLEQFNIDLSRERRENILCKGHNSELKDYEGSKKFHKRIKKFI